MLGLISLGGDCRCSSLLAARCAGAQLVIAADSGMKHLDALGIRPDLLVGDMDSIPTELLDAVQADATVEIARYSPRKSRTDSEIAVDAALARGCDRLVFLGAGGNRPDHVLANQMMAASLALRGIPCILSDGTTFMHTITTGNSPFHYPLSGLTTTRDVLSVVPVFGDITHLRISGLEYPLDNQPIRFGSTMAVSNTVPETASDDTSEAVVSVDSGVVFFIHTVNDGPA